MKRLKTHRRKVLTAAASCTVAGIVGVGSAQEGSEPSTGTHSETGSSSSISQTSFKILEETAYETTVYETTASADGKTVMVVGGIHGNETAGYRAARSIAEWKIDAGTLVVIPRANVPAIEERTRSGPSNGDLNRQFPEEQEPATELAQAIWNVVLKYDPDMLIDLHESTGIYAGNPVDGVGQAIFHSGHSGAGKEAQQAVDDLNKNHIGNSHPEFMTGNFSAPTADPRGLLVHKASRDLGARSFLIETLSQDIALETRANWQTQLVEELASDELLEESTAEESTNSTETTESTSTETTESNSTETTPSNSTETTTSNSTETTESTDTETTPSNSTETPEPTSTNAGTSTEDTAVEEPKEKSVTEGSEKPDRDTSADTTDCAGKPVARINTSQTCTDEKPPREGETVTLDASESCVPDGTITRYKWDINDDEHFGHSGETVDVTICADGEYPITLCVTSEEGKRTVTKTVLTTN